MCGISRHATHHRLQPSEIMDAKGLVFSSEPRYAGHEHEYTMSRPEACSAAPIAA